MATSGENILDALEARFSALDEETTTAPRLITMATLEDRVASLGANHRKTPCQLQSQRHVLSQRAHLWSTHRTSSTSPASASSSSRPSSPYPSESEREDEEEEEGASEDDQPLSDAELTQRMGFSMRHRTFSPREFGHSRRAIRPAYSRARRAVRWNSCALFQIITILP